VATRNTTDAIVGVVLTSLLAPPLCWSCGCPARLDEPLCLGCRRTLRHLGREPIPLSGIEIWAAVAYEGAARELVRGLKFRGAIALANVMAALISANAPGELLPRALDRSRPPPPSARTDPRSAADPPRSQPPALVPVPLHPARRRKRGFNQASILAEALARRTGLAVADRLTRSGAAGTQVGRARPARLAAPPGSIQAHAPIPARAVLVDDVATTGSTLAACARTLRAEGALEVRAVTFARTLGR
jgi:predicted amidophosphoribosyltransferase